MFLINSILALCVLTTYVYLAGRHLLHVCHWRGTMAQDPRSLIQKAEKTLSSASGGFRFFGGGKEEKYQEAADLYIQAANAFRMQQMNVEAGQTFEKAAQVQRNELKDPDDAANTAVDAFKVYRKDKPEAAVRVIEPAIQQYCSKGNFRRAASHKESQGEVYEVDLGDMPAALKCYEEAAGWYEGDNAAALANKLWLKVADISALSEDYYKAIKIYEKVANQSVSNNLMRYSVKEYFLKGGICHLATQDMVGAERALANYVELDPTFASTREHQLLTDLLAAVQSGKQEEFTDKLFAYDQMSKLDKWKTALLLKIKNQIQEAEDDFS
ncbi:hypothetical protein P8C59_005349 [Phyllachora maydis]|uniref:Alpha-soluble NSF attachment protein n=1 Tax=Phyllachora maydis TaxID=1825666 RepID=A0AAD9I5U8_9PEZI|nr:hypothetical protein P8C59_005349 [Phyllachora maydis]